MVVEHVPEVLIAQMTPQMITMEVLIERVSIEEKLFAKVTPWMWQNFGASVTGRVSMLNVTPELLHMVDPLLSYKHSATF